jgi:hypothetical protein
LTTITLLNILVYGTCIFKKERRSLFFAAIVEKTKTINVLNWIVDYAVCMQIFNFIIAEPRAEYDSDCC